MCRNVSETKIKICGLKRPEDIAYVNEMQPDYIGLVFFEKSSRYVSPQQAALLRSMLDPSITVVGVFLDNELELVQRLAAEGTIDMIQLHGASMGEHFMEELRKRTDKTIIRAFSMAENAQADKMGGNSPLEGKLTVSETQDKLTAEEPANSSAGYILLDSGKGGTGKSFDWSIVKGLERPFFLAGGLHPDNVREAISRLHPYAVDVSSGVETEGKKDPEKIRRFIEAVRGQR